MRIFKFIFKILLVIIFIFSIVLNFVLVGSSNGSLVFKYNQDKLSTMAETSDNNLKMFLDGKSNKTIVFNVVLSDETLNYTFYVNKEGKIFMKAVSTKDDKTATFYYQDEKLYTLNGDIKTSEDCNLSTMYNTYYSKVYSLTNYNLLGSSIDENKEKSKIDFSFKPFYLLGIKYTAKATDGKVTYKYDLKGNLRVVEADYEDDSKDYKLTINYSSKTLKMPDFSEFSAK